MHQRPYPKLKNKPEILSSIVKDREVGTYNGTGINCGKGVYEGPRGGLYFYNNNHNKSYVIEDLVDFF